jgi:hypothetical protein
MRRREFIGAWSVVGATAVSGCSEDSQDPDPPSSKEETASDLITEIKEEEPSLELLDTRVDIDNTVFYTRNRCNTTAFRPWIRAVTPGNKPPFKRLP